MTAGLQANETGMRRMLTMTPMNRLGEPEEVAATAFFFPSDESSYFTGSCYIPAEACSTARKMCPDDLLMVPKWIWTS